MRMKKMSHSTARLIYLIGFQNGKGYRLSNHSQISRTATTNDGTPTNVSHHIGSAVRCGVSSAVNFVSVNYLRAWNALCDP